MTTRTSGSRRYSRRRSASCGTARLCQRSSCHGRSGYSPPQRSPRPPIPYQPQPGSVSPRLQSRPPRTFCWQAWKCLAAAEHSVCSHFSRIGGACCSNVSDCACFPTAAARTADRGTHVLGILLVLFLLLILGSLLLVLLGRSLVGSLLLLLLLLGVSPAVSVPGGPRGANSRDVDSRRQEERREGREKRC